MKITEEMMKQQTGGEPAANTPAPPEAPRQTEREKLSAMSFKDKLWYIWTYYKFHIGGVIAAILLVCGIGSAMYRSTFTNELYCIFLNNRAGEELNTAPLEQDFSAYLGLGKKQEITTESLFIDFGEAATEFSYASMGKISALLAAKELDIIISDSEALDYYAAMGGFRNLEQELSPDTLALVKNRLYYTDGKDGSAYPYAIDLSGTAFAKDSNLTLTPPLLGVIITSEHSDTVERLIQYIFAN